MRDLRAAGFTSFDGADHYGPAEDLLGALLPVLAGILGRDGKGGFKIDWIVGE